MEPESTEERANIMLFVQRGDLLQKPTRFFLCSFNFVMELKGSLHIC